MRSEDGWFLIAFEICVNPECRFFKLISFCHLLLCSSTSFAERLVAFACVEGIFFSGRSAIILEFGYIYIFIFCVTLDLTFFPCSQFLCHILAEKEGSHARLDLLKWADFKRWRSPLWLCMPFIQVNLFFMPIDFLLLFWLLDDRTLFRPVCDFLSQFDLQTSS